MDLTRIEAFEYNGVKEENKEDDADKVELTSLSFDEEP